MDYRPYSRYLSQIILLCPALRRSITRFTFLPSESYRNPVITSKSDIKHLHPPSLSSPLAIDPSLTAMRPLVPRQPKAILIGPSSPRLGSPRFISTRTLASQFLLQPKHRLQLTRARARTMSTATNPPIPTILSSAAPPSIEPQFSQGTCDDPAELRAALAPLLVENGGRWTLMANGEGLEREFRFKTFARTWVSGYFSLSNSNIGGSCLPISTNFIRTNSLEEKRCDVD